MTSFLLTLAASVAVAGMTYFIVAMFADVRAYKAMSLTERRRIDIAEDEAARTKPTYRQRFTLALERNGYTGQLSPVLGAIAFGYLVIATTLRMVHLSPLISAIVAAPVAVAVTIAAFNTIARRRRARFVRQLEQLFSMLATQLEAGAGIQLALTNVLATSADPLRYEVNRVIGQTFATKDLVDAFRDLQRTYPSHALEMFVAALDLNQSQSGQLAPALSRAAEILRRDFELAEEAAAELSQTRMEAYAVVAIIGGIALKLLTSGDPTTRGAYGTPVAVIALTFAGAWFALGIWRVTRILRRARGES